MLKYNRGGNHHPPNKMKGDVLFKKSKERTFL
jgi:hypothetical protein